MPTHEFQLVLQLPEGCPLDSLDFEDEIAEALGNASDDPNLPHQVDGNSYGADTIEFFVSTNRPIDAFELCKPLLVSRGLLNMVTAAWCNFADHQYTVIWPASFCGEFRP
jgi:hypothetical protein